MPNIYTYKPNTDSLLSVWRIDEDLEFFKKNTKLYHSESQEAKNYSGLRLREWYACRYLLHQFLPKTNRPPCLKDPFGKPILLGSKLHSSLSHSHDMVAVSLSKNNHGIDIQRLSPKIRNIRHKFISDTEMQAMQNPDNIHDIHLYWGAKECLYKAYGKKKLNFIQQLHINAFKSNSPEGRTQGYISLPTARQKYSIIWKTINDNYLLVYATHLP